MRIILFTGKGGVGKTTIAATTAIQIAKAGHKTLVISTDPAHSLSDALDTELTPEPTEIAKNLWAQELDVYYSMQKYWKNIRQLMLSVFKWQGMEHVLAEEMSALPGMEEASAFLWIEKYYTDDEYDVVVIDSAPTGETLTLLTLPQVTKWWMTKAFPFQKFAIKNVGRVARYAMGVPLDYGYEELENIFNKLERIRHVFADPKVCSIRIVTNPERMVINESKRAYTYMSLYGYNVDAIIVNRIMEGNVKGTILEQYLADQADHLEDIKQSFADVPLFKVPHQGREVFGMNSLTKLGTTIFGKTALSEVLYEGKNVLFEQKDDRHILKIRLPFLDAKNMVINKYGDELILQIKNKRQALFLPKFIKLHNMESYEYIDPWLHVVLAE